MTHARQIRKGEDENAGANVSVRRFYIYFDVFDRCQKRALAQSRT